MELVPLYLEGLERASLNAERAFQAVFSPEHAHVPEVERHIWAAAAVLHCDILRYLVTFENATRKGLIRLLWMGDIVSMLYEAKTWFTKVGGPKLLEISESRGYETAKLRQQIKTIKKAYPLNGVEAFAEYRNKVGHHYDAEFVTHLYEFSATDAENFYVVLSNYAKFSNEWTSLCSSVLSSGRSPKA